MDKMTAENFSKQVKAMKHCEKLLARIDKHGEAVVKLNATGVTFVVTKQTPLYIDLVGKYNELRHIIDSYELVKAFEQQEKKELKAIKTNGAPKKSENKKGE